MFYADWKWRIYLHIFSDNIAYKYYHIKVDKLPIEIAYCHEIVSDNYTVENVLLLLVENYN